MVLDEARRCDIELVTLGIEGEADPALEAEASAFHWIGLSQLSRCVRLFRDAGVSEAIMAGRVRHARAFQLLRPDRLMLKVLSRLHSRSTDTMLKTLADVLSEEGVELLDSTTLLKPYLAVEGAMTKRTPIKDELEDLRFGLEIARGIATLDVGQTVVIKAKAVVAAEAMEGTDAAIRRARDVVDGPFSVVKVARPRQDFRFDVPVVGPNTIESMMESGASVLGLEAGKVLLLQRDELLRSADENKIAVYGV